LVPLVRNSISVARADYMLLLKAFSSAGDFFTQHDGPMGLRLQQLAGMITVECMGLREITTYDSLTNNLWVVGHPMLGGVGVVQPGVPNPQDLTARAERELRAIWFFVENLSPQIQGAAAPQSLTMISFGLLLFLAYEAYLTSPHGSDPNAFWQVRYLYYDMKSMAALSSMAIPVLTRPAILSSLYVGVS
jgi:hypothetical protein